MAQSAFDATLMGGPPYFDVFEEGSVATGGSITECATSFVRVTEDLTADQKTSLVGKKLKSDSSSVNAIIIGVEDRGDSSTESNDQFCVLCINYSEGLTRRCVGSCIIIKVIG